MKKLLIIGAGSAGNMIAKEIINHKETSAKYKIVGFLDDDPNKKNAAGISVVGKIIDAKSVIKKHEIEEVIIAIPSAGRKLINKIVNELSGISVKIKIVPGLYEIIEGNVRLSQIRDIEPSDLLGRQEIGFDIEKILPFYKDKVIFITGAGGSIGSEILLQLLKLPVKKVVGLGHGENSIHDLISRVSVDKRFDYVIGDIKDRKKLEFELKKFKPDIFFHAAAHKHVPLMEEYPDEAVKNNIIGTYNCAQSAIKTKTSNFILISTDKAVNPTSVMGATKRIAEKIVLSLNELQNTTNFSLTRFGNVLSSRGSVIPIFTEQIKKGGPITVTHDEITRFFMSIPEAARLVIKSASVKEGNIFVLDMGEQVKIVDLAKNLIKLYGFNENDIPIVFTGLRPGEKMYEEILMDSENITKSGYDKLLISSEKKSLFDKNKLNKLINDFRDASDNVNKSKIKKLLNKYISKYNS